MSRTFILNIKWGAIFLSLPRKHFFQNFRVILNSSLQKCFSGKSCMVIYLACSNLQPHSSVYLITKGSTGRNSFVNSDLLYWYFFLQVRIEFCSNVGGMEPKTSRKVFKWFQMFAQVIKLYTGNIYRCYSIVSYIDQILLWHSNLWISQSLIMK